MLSDEDRGLVQKQRCEIPKVLLQVQQRRQSFPALLLRVVQQRLLMAVVGLSVVTECGHEHRSGVPLYVRQRETLR